MDEPALLEQAAALLGRILTTAWERPDWFIFGLGMLGVLGGAAWKWLLPRLRSPAPSVTADPSFPFEVVQPKSSGVLKMLMGSDQKDDDPLADFNIPYQQRRSDSLAQEQLGGLLDVHRWLLILGRTGLGKTREAAELAQQLNGEGWMVLKLKNAEQLVVPTQFPAAAVGEQPRLLFFLDNLNQAMVLGNVALERERGDALPSALKQSLQDHLNDTLAFFERSCGTDRVRVIATARNETVPEKDGQPSEWDKLAVERYPDFWGQFHHHELPVPEEGAIVAVLRTTTQQAELPAVADDFGAIARRNDGTFRNVVENLERAKNQDLTVSKHTYKDALGGTWQSLYQAAIRRDPAAKYLYDAVDVLRQCNVELHELTVLPTAALVACQTKPWQLWQRYTLRRSLNRLSQTERILQPRDGQIEAKGYTAEAGERIAQVGMLLLRLAKQHPGRLENSLFGFVVAAVDRGGYREVLRVNTQLTKQQPNNEFVWFIQAGLQHELGDKAGAIACYDAALAIKPDYHKALFNKGLALDALGDKAGAIACYDAALAIKLDFHEALDNKGNALHALGDKAGAIACYDDALAIKPDYHQALDNKGVTLNALGDKAGAIACFDAALAIKPDDHNALFNKACCYSLKGEIESAIAALQAAIDLDSKYRDMAKTDTDFDLIRHDERFQALVEGGEE